MKRRDFPKMSMASFLALVGQAEEILVKTHTQCETKVKSIILLVGDGWPLGVMKALWEFQTERFKEISHRLRLMNNPKTKICLQKTSSLSSVVTDSAPVSVAWATGSKRAN
ncbi:MAG: hypothetical protein N2513_09815 [Deltaproteobacteria bacterium]|nr:hypothetical protein [Deltaproteobacteria bacterium]